MYVEALEEPFAREAIQSLYGIYFSTVKLVPLRCVYTYWMLCACIVCICTVCFVYLHVLLKLFQFLIISK